MPSLRPRLRVKGYAVTQGAGIAALAGGIGWQTTPAIGVAVAGALTLAVGVALEIDRPTRDTETE